MAAPLNASLPPFFTLTKGCTIQVTALDPTNGNVVTAVVASNVGLAVDQQDSPSTKTEFPVTGAFLPA